MRALSSGDSFSSGSSSGGGGVLNQLRMLAERFPQANIHAILEAIGSDSRIGQKYLRAGLSYGGPCFPRDNRLLAYTARQAGLEAPLAEPSTSITIDSTPSTTLPDNRPPSAPPNN